MQRVLTGSAALSAEARVRSAIAAHAARARGMAPAVADQLGRPATLRHDAGHAGAHRLDHHVAERLCRLPHETPDEEEQRPVVVDARLRARRIAAP